MNKFKKSDLFPMIVLGTFLLVLIIVANAVLNIINYIFG